VITRYSFLAGMHHMHYMMVLRPHMLSLSTLIGPEYEFLALEERYRTLRETMRAEKWKNGASVAVTRRRDLSYPTAFKLGVGGLDESGHCTQTRHFEELIESLAMGLLVGGVLSWYCSPQCN